MAPFRRAARHRPASQQQSWYQSRRALQEARRQVELEVLALRHYR